MSINWVMLSPSTTPPFTPLPNEQTLYTSPPRIALAISLPTHYPGKQQQGFSMTSSSGLIYLTNRRIIYLPAQQTDKLQSFTAPLLNLHDSHVTAPFFGPNIWQALLQPVSGGGIPTPSAGVVELKLTFKEGGAFDFHTNFERVKERLQQAVETSHISGDGTGSSRAAMNGVEVGNVNLDDLPAYQERNDGPLIAPVSAAMPAVHSSTVQRSNGVAVEQGGPASKPPGTGSAAPAEPPPDYEESQMAGVQDEVERRSSAAGL